MSRSRRSSKRAGRSRSALPLVFGVLAILGSLALVVWRQTRGAEMERRVRAVQEEYAIAEAERLELVKRIQALSSRARVTRVARERLGMHLPSDSEIVFLPLPAGAAPDSVEPTRSER